MDEGKGETIAEGSSGDSGASSEASPRVSEAAIAEAAEGSTAETRATGAGGGLVPDASVHAGYVETPCTSGTAAPQGGLVACEEGYFHRPAAVGCASDVPRSDTFGDLSTNGAPEDECHSDADCPGGALGYCDVAALHYDGPNYRACKLGCRSDDDCGEGSLCVCGDPIGACVTATCRTDADCSDGTLCLGTENSIGYLCPTSFSFSCSDPSDECVVDVDCGDINMHCALTNAGRRCAPNAMCS